jgi:hypothetical protein
MATDCLFRADSYLKKCAARAAAVTQIEKKGKRNRRARVSFV